MMLPFLCKYRTLTPKNRALDSQSLPKFTTVSSSSSSLTGLINSCGLSDQFLVRSKSSETPNSALKFFQHSGFSQSQINTLVSKRPNILFANPEKTLKPKIDFLISLGISESDVPNIVTINPAIFRRSLKNHLVPSFDLLKNSLGGTREAVRAIKCCPFILDFNVPENLAPNLATLRNLGLPESRVLKLLWGVITNKVIVGTKPQCFSKVVSDILDMGFDPLSWGFVQALKVMGFCCESTWERKLGFFRSLGFSEDEFLDMFRKQPTVMSMPEEKVRGAVQFYVDKFGWTPSQLSKSPNVLIYSLEKRIIPRSLVLQILASRNRIHKRVKLISVLVKTESIFMQRYVTKYEDEIPELLDAYQGKMKYEQCNFYSEEMRRLSHCKIAI